MKKGERSEKSSDRNENYTIRLSVSDNSTLNIPSLYLQKRKCDFFAKRKVMNVEFSPRAYCIESMFPDKGATKEGLPYQSSKVPALSTDTFKFFLCF